MASQLPPSTSLLTSPTDFRGIPISQLIAALYAPSTTGPSAQYGTPVMHSTSASFQKGIDPRNRRKAGGESEAARGSRLIRERRARQAARAEAAKTEAEAAKNTGTIMRTIGGMTGGTVGTKPAPAREGGFPPLAEQVSNRRDILMPQGPLVHSDPMPAAPAASAKQQPVEDRSYDAAESARLGARTMGPPSSVYRAPEAAPVSRKFDDPTLRPEVAAAFARVEDDPTKPSGMYGTPHRGTDIYAGSNNYAAYQAGEDWAKKYALGDVELFKEGLAERRGEFGPTQFPRGSISEEGSFNYGADQVRRDFSRAQNEQLSKETLLADLEFREAQRKVAEIEAQMRASSDAYRAQEIESFKNLPVGLFGNFKLPSDVYNALRFKPVFVR